MEILRRVAPQNDIFVSVMLSVAVRRSRNILRLISFATLCVTKDPSIPLRSTQDDKAGVFARDDKKWVVGMTNCKSG